ncbi:hypothetical protein [Arenibaculum pallidiluteum]|uniref:hypothetical protein n=1 Tax=Arenibaculum pallidiluteum TaxID=2812559 RepID=UPI001A96196E|nr:hypothetical protein [Arenibaculum pallidiluteum]
MSQSRTIPETHIDELQIRADRPYALTALAEPSTGVLPDSAMALSRPDRTNADPLDLALELTFPASDPPASTPLVGLGSSRLSGSDAR